MTDKELDFIITSISKSARMSMDDVATVLRSYFEMMELGRCNLAKSLNMSWGVIGLDKVLNLNKGITMIAGHESCGKTSLAKKIAQSARLQGLTVAYYDADNKLYLHDLEPLMGLDIIFANSYRDSGITELIKSGLIDVLIIDSLTSLHMTSHHSFIAKIRKDIPFIIFTAQTRNEWGTGKAIPACDDRIASMTNCEIMLSSKEQITIEAEDVARIQFKIVKNEVDRDKEKQMGSFILKDNMVDTPYSAFDILRTRGRIKSIGEVKYLDKTEIGKVKQLEDVGKEKVKRLVIKTALEELKMNWSTYERVYGKDPKDIYKAKRDMSEMSDEEQSSGGDNIPNDKREL